MDRKREPSCKGCGIAPISTLSGWLALRRKAGFSDAWRGSVFVNIPQNFSHDLLRGECPAVLLEADATDPIATSGGASALGNIVDIAFQTDFVGPLEFLAPSSRSIDIRVHSLYNPEANTSYNIVPGLMGVVLTMTMVMITALAITREYERGTMENLLVDAASSE